jgi:hypothetical protein
MSRSLQYLIVYTIICVTYPFIIHSPLHVFSIHKLTTFPRYRTVLPSEVAALRGALLFVVHPVHVESVTPMVGRADLLCACFYIPALLFYEKSLDPGMHLSSHGEWKGIWRVIGSGRGDGGYSMA